MSAAPASPKMDGKDKPAAAAGAGDSKAAAAEADSSDLVEDAAEAQLVAQEMVEKLEIVGTRKVQKTKSEKMHVDYIVHVTTSIAGVSWNVNRRYNAFVELHAALKKALNIKSDKDLPALPPKHTLSLTRTASSIETIAKRKAELGVYLNLLLKNPLIAKSEPWCAFLVGTFHDIFSRLKAFAVKNAKLTSELSISEQQRLAALAQLQAERRKTEELRDANASLEAQLKAAKELAAKQVELLTKLESDLATARAEAKARATERDAKANELAALQQTSTAYRTAAEDELRALRDANAAQAKAIAQLKAEVQQLLQQKKLLVKGVKELREGKVNTTAHVESTSIPVHAAMAVFASGIKTASEQGADHVAPAITPGTGASLSIAAPPVAGTPSGVPVAASPLTAAAAGAPGK